MGRIAVLTGVAHEIAYGTKIWLAAGVTDMRAGMSGLASGKGAVIESN